MDPLVTSVFGFLSILGVPSLVVSVGFAAVVGRLDPVGAAFGWSVRCSLKTLLRTRPHSVDSFPTLLSICLNLGFVLSSGFSGRSSSKARAWRMR